MSALTVKLPAAEPSASIALVAHYCGHGESLAILPDADVEEPQLRTKPFGRGFTTISGHNTICRFIADSSKFKAQLLGRTKEAAALISQWLSYRNLALVPLMDDKLHKVSGQQYAMASRFECGPAIGFASQLPSSGCVGTS